MPGTELDVGTHVEEYDASRSEARGELVNVDLLDVGAVAEIRVGEPLDARYVLRCDIAYREPEIDYTLAGQPVEDSRPAAATCHETGTGQDLEMLGRVGD